MADTKTPAKPGPLAKTSKGGAVATMDDILKRAKAGVPQTMDAGDNSFLPRVGFYANGANDVNSGRIENAHYGQVVGGELNQIGKTMLAMLLAWRNVAKVCVEGSITTTSFDPASDTYKKIKEEAAVKGTDGKPVNKGRWYGPEALLWVPDFGLNLLYFGKSPTDRRTATDGKLNEQIGRVLEFGSGSYPKKVDGQDKIIMNMAFKPVDTELSATPTEEADDALNKFMNGQN